MNFLNYYSIGEHMKKNINTQNFKDEVKKVQWIGRLVNYWNLKQYKVRLDVCAWQIFEIDYGMNVGHEFSGRHYGVAIHDSPFYNPIITVIPIKTSRGKLNPNSDVYLGKIEGIQSLKNSIAVINQIHSIDKIRIFNIDSINKKVKPKTAIYLNEEQINIIQNGIQKILFKN